MEKLNHIINIIKEHDSRIEITRKKIYIQNYLDITEFKDNFIKINTFKEKVSIKGNNLVISKLTKDELLISGHFKVIEFGGLKNE